MIWERTQNTSFFSSDVLGKYTLLEVASDIEFTLEKKKKHYNTIPLFHEENRFKMVVWVVYAAITHQFYFTVAVCNAKFEDITSPKYLFAPVGFRMAWLQPCI